MSSGDMSLPKHFGSEDLLKFGGDDCKVKPACGRGNESEAGADGNKFKADADEAKGDDGDYIDKVGGGRKAKLGGGGGDGERGKVN